MVSPFPAAVVYHLVPTSNHNMPIYSEYRTKVVYHLVPTSNHNPHPAGSPGGQLFIILFLHQTTTAVPKLVFCARLFIILFLHQTTTPVNKIVGISVVYHLVPTSNHNRYRNYPKDYLLFIILFLHQTTTISLYFRLALSLFIILFLHQTTTETVCSFFLCALFIILFLHQTTTLCPWK